MTKVRKRRRGVRRFLQIGLRTLLVGSVLTGILSGAVFTSSTTILLNWTTVAELERHGVRIESDFQRRFGLIPPARKGTFAPLLEWTTSEPQDVNLSLMVNYSADSAIEQMAKMSQVRRVCLTATNVTNQGIRQLSDLQGVQELLLASTSIGDQGLSQLENLSELRRLDLSDTNITDDGLYYLARMPWLREVSLRGTKITQGGFIAVQNSCPRTLFHSAYSRQRVAGYGPGLVRFAP